MSGVFHCFTKVGDRLAERITLLGDVEKRVLQRCWRSPTEIKLMNTTNNTPLGNIATTITMALIVLVICL